MNFGSVRSIVSIAILPLAVACVTIKESDYEPIPPASNAPARLQWSPEIEGKNLGIGIGVVAPEYQVKLDIQSICRGYECDPAATAAIEETLGLLQTALKRDIENALLAKGFNVTGRFDSLDSMTYAQKEKSNLVLRPEINPTVKSQPGSEAAVYWEHPLRSQEPEGQLRIFRLKAGQREILANPKFERTGQVSVSGTISMAVYEPLSSEKMWLKPLDFPPQSQRYAFYYWQEQVTDKKGKAIGPPENHLINGYDSRGDAVVKAFEAIYPELYKGFKTYFSKEEMIQVRLDAEKIRKLKRY
jgi:hypothetical protein